MRHHLRDFDALAATWEDNPVRVERAQKMAQLLRQELPLQADWHLLDYGCGTGLTAVLLADTARQVLAADTSRGMLEVLANRLRQEDIRNVHPRLWDLTAGPLPPERFDLIYSVMTLHHIPEPEALVRRFTELLRPGGWLVLADLDAEDGDFHPDPTGVFHHGFAAETMQGFLAHAGLEQRRSLVAHRMAHTTAAGIEKIFPVLLTLGRKA